MKKTLVALAVAAVAATSANAAVVYDNDGSKVEVKGSLRVLLARDGDQRGDLKNNGSRLKFNAQQDLGNGLSAFGNVEIRFGEHKLLDNEDESTFGNPVTKRLYAGLKQEGVGALSFGRQLTNGDDVELGEYSYVWGGNNNLTTESRKSIKFRSADFNGFSFGLDYLFGTALKDAPQGLENVYNKARKNGYGAAVFYTTPFTEGVNMNLAAGYGQDKNNAGDTQINWRAAAEFEFGPAALAANYGQSKLKGDNTKTTYLLVGGKYTIADTSTLYGQWMREKTTDESALNSYVAGVDYKLHKNVVTFVEFARAQKWNDAESKKDYENKYGAGLRVYF
ncbi:porin [Spirabiliibacterium falconis]|uniref:porin n=1 Tax=Spirabiliibacterium falconis TaxID=572023 RepID=UPI001AACC150|nr:porin [Spirabiliibacterium falconis]MBE2893703.1 porin [Spirabiliibacterium falconis]